MPGQPRLSQRCKWYATAATYTQVAVLPWSYVAEMGTKNSLTLRRNTASIVKDVAYTHMLLVQGVHLYINGKLQ